MNWLWYFLKFGYPKNAFIACCQMKLESSLRMSIIMPPEWKVCGKLKCSSIMAIAFIDSACELFYVLCVRLSQFDEIADSLLIVPVWRTCTISADCPILTKSRELEASSESSSQTYFVFYLSFILHTHTYMLGRVFTSLLLSNDVGHGLISSVLLKCAMSSVELLENQGQRHPEHGFLKCSKIILENQGQRHPENDFRTPCTVTRPASPLRTSPHV